MNRHNDKKVIKTAERSVLGSYLQELIARQMLGDVMTGDEKRKLLRMRAFNLVGRKDEHVKR